jgi:hypothetical protein
MEPYATRRDLLLTSLLAALPLSLTGAGRQSAQSGSDYHQAAGRVADRRLPAGP